MAVVGRFLDPMVVGDDSQVLGGRRRPDQFFDDVVGQLAPTGETNGQAVAVLEAWAGKGDVGGIEDDGDGAGLCSKGGLEETKQALTSLLQTRWAEGIRHDAESMQQVVAVDEVLHGTA